MRTKAMIFDLDGTLIDTLGDIADAINEALSEAGIPLHHEKAAVRKMIGNGAAKLMHRALGEYDNEENFNKLSVIYPVLYKEYQTRDSHPFEGMVETLEKIKGKGVNLFVCSNKPHELAQIIMAQEYGPELFSLVLGHRPGEPVKPDPHLVYEMMDSFGFGKNEAVFVGDSLPDLETARNAGLPIAMCTWGYGEYTDELLSQCDYIIREPKDLLELIDA